MQNPLIVLATFVAIPLLLGLCPAGADSSFASVRSFGAKGDGKTDDTTAVQRAIDACAAAGGGAVVLPAGTYLCSPVFLKSNITLRLEAGAKLLGSRDWDAYPVVHGRWEGIVRDHKASLITGLGLENIAIEGRGVIDGQGDAWWGEYKKSSKLADSYAAQGITSPPPGKEEEFSKAQRCKYPRPRLVNLIDCKNVTIRDVTLRDSPSWTLHTVFCENVIIDGLTIEAPFDSQNTDGIDVDSCRLVRISNCNLSTGDDCIVIKSGKNEDGRRVGKPSEDITITNCITREGHAGVAIGSEMSGGVRNVAVSNCVFDGTKRGIRIKTCRGRGGVVENVSYDNIVMRNMTGEAISITMAYSGKVDPAEPEPVTEGTPIIRGISISDVRVNGARDALVCDGLPEMPVTDVSISNIRITAERGMRWISARSVDLNNVEVKCSTGPAIECQNAQAFRVLRPQSEAPAQEP